MRFRIAGPQITHEKFDDEVVIVNLMTGSYYSAEEEGARIWDLALAGLSEEELVTRLGVEFAGNVDEMAGAAANFLRELVQEGLIVSDADSSGGGRVAVASAFAAKRQFRAPALEKYTDMEELLALDPVHEVEETGWPRKKEA